MATPITVAAFEELFEQLFTAHDKNGNGSLEKDEARELMQVINSKRPDGQEFDETRFTELFDKFAEDGKISKEKAHQLALKRGQTLGFIESA